MNTSFVAAPIPEKGVDMANSDEEDKVINIENVTTQVAMLYRANEAKAVAAKRTLSITRARSDSPSRTQRTRPAKRWSRCGARA